MNIANNFNSSILHPTSFNSSLHKGKVDSVSFEKVLSRDLIQFSNPNLSFSKKNQPSQETMRYINKVRKFLNSNGMELSSLNRFDLNKIDDICTGINVFKDWTAKDLALLTNNFRFISLSKGCYHQCSHCGPDSPKKVSFMNWENFTDLSDGIGMLSKRLGFNPFKNTLNSSEIYPFLDSDPFSFRASGKDSQVHGIYDATNYFFDKTGLKFTLTTAGWEKSNKVAQSAAENLAQDSDSIRAFNISIHPFHGYLVKSRYFMDRGDFNQSKFWRERYISMMANVLETSWPIIQSSKGHIILEYADPKKTNFNYSFYSSVQLLKEIFETMKTKNPKFNFSYIVPMEDFNQIDDNDKIEIREIDLLGRATLLNPTKNITPTRSPNPDDFNFENIQHYPKIIGVDGTVLANVSPMEVSPAYVAFPKKLNFQHPTDMKQANFYPTLNDNNLTYQTPTFIINRDADIQA